MRVIYIVGSPKKKMSTTAALLGALSERIKDSEPIFLTTSGLSPENAEQEAGKAAALIKGADAVIIGFPLYIDAIPSHLLRFLEALGRELVQNITELGDLIGENDVTEHRQTVYTIINSGFYEPDNMLLAADMVELWCDGSGLDCKGALLVGAGGMGPMLANGKGAGKPVGKALKALADAVTAGSSIGTIKTEPALPRSWYIRAAHSSWKKAAKKRGISKAGLCDRSEK